MACIDRISGFIFTYNYSLGKTVQNETVYDVVIVGAGIVGLATAQYLSKNSKAKILVIDAEADIAHHQTGNNSGVVHSGLYYEPGSLKARNCIEGRERLYAYCERNNIEHERCGKLVVATNEAERKQLDHLEYRSIENGLRGLKRLSIEEMHEYEPHVKGVSALLVPETGIVDYLDVSKAYAWHIKNSGNSLRLNTRLLSVKRDGTQQILETSSGEIETRNIVNCAGLQCDRVARLCGVAPEIKIVPFRGEYYKLKEDKQYLVKNLIYPVPNLNFPFLGVHFTRRIHGGIDAGPNAVLAFKREGYHHSDFSLKDSAETFSYPGFWVLALKYGLTGMGEIYRSYSKNAFVKALQGLLPEITPADVEPGGAGIRAQALNLSGKLVDDFYIKEAKDQIHVLNAPSPAATASLSIGETIARKVLKNFDLK